jgi:predicted RNase H-like nuclease (RuvC/YqgF family)
MYLSGSEAAKAAGVAKSTISKALHSGKLSYAEKRPDGYKIDPAELFRVFPKPSETGSEKPHSNDWKPDENPEEAATSAPVLEAQLESLKALIAEKERRIADLEANREQLRGDRERLVRNHQDERERLLKVIEEQAGTVKLLTDQSAKQTPAPPRGLFARLFGTRTA